LDFQRELGEIFKADVRLSFYSATSIFQHNPSKNFLKGMSKGFAKVYKNRQATPTLRAGYFFTYLGIRFRAPELVVQFLSDALERRRDHYTIVGAFSKMLNHFNLKDFNLAGFRLGFYGRLNGRDRKFRYFITRGPKPGLRSICLKVDYAEEQCIAFYGVVHIHMWLYRY